MVHAQVYDEYINFTLIYMTDNIFLVLPIKQLANKDGKPTTPHYLATGIEPSLSNLRVLFFPYVVQKATTHVVTKALNMCHQSQFFSGVFVGISQYHKGYHI